MYEYRIEEINLENIEGKNKVDMFLKNFNLMLDEDVDYTIVLKKEEEIVGTCSKAKNVLKCFAVSKELRGRGLTSILINNIIDKCFEEGIYHTFIFTKPENIDIFTAFNYKLIAAVEKGAILENGIYDINKYLDKISVKYNIDSQREKAAMVMNCNPFTLGHQYLIEKASLENEEVIVFVVEENKSIFPFDVRFELVKQGTKHLKNVKIIPGGEYIISQATFPSYFLRKEDERLKVFTELDADIFGKYYCNRFKINKRYVGDEPYCNVTACYNNNLGRVLSQYEVELVEVERKSNKKEAISASQVRRLIKRDDLNEVENLVPKSTWEFFDTLKGKELIERIKHSNSPH